jgi:HD-GYP domain-containing protein (c-di-GMP phosphodiesterase class II)
VIQAVNAAMLEIQGALLARSLYPKQHPRIRACEERALGHLAKILEQRPEITLFAVDDRVIFENEILPSRASLVDTLFRMLHLRGVDQLTFRRGLCEKEIRDFLDTLADGVRNQKATVKASAHLGLGSLKAVDRGDEPIVGESEADPFEFAREAAEVLPGIWENLGQHQRLDASLLGDIVSCVSKVISDSSSAIFPLAPLKRHDEYTFVHTINVAILSTAMGEVLGFGSHDLHELSISAMLHDVGKQAIPEAILKKTERYTDEEFRIMQTHPAEGARILLNSPGIPEIAPIVAYEHHIRANGGGYPKVPTGWKLNLASRVVQLADVFDALRTYRPYRPGLPVPRIVEVMKSDVGTFFDADLLELFLQNVVSRGIPEPALPSPPN